MIYSGADIHAMDAETELPNHEMSWHSAEEQQRGIAETACGGILKRLGKVNTVGKVGDIGVDITWNHMKVKCPILSVLRLAKEGHDIWLHKDGGEVIDSKTGKKMPFLVHHGVYYMKILVTDPTTDAKSNVPGFARLGA